MWRVLCDGEAAEAEGAEEEEAAEAAGWSKKNTKKHMAMWGKHTNKKTLLSTFLNGCLSFQWKTIIYSFGAGLVGQFVSTGATHVNAKHPKQTGWMITIHPHMGIAENISK